MAGRKDDQRLRSRAPRRALAVGGSADPAAGPLPAAALSGAPVLTADLVEQLAVAMGEQSALVIDAMDRWFAHLSMRLGVESPALSAREPESPGPLLAGEPLARFEPRLGWQGWGHHQSSVMLPGGVVEVRQDVSTPGVVTPSVAAAGGMILRAAVSRRDLGSISGPNVVVRVVDGGGAALGPDVGLDERVEAVVYAPKRVESIKVCLLASEPTPGFRFAIDSVAVEAFDVDEWRAAGPSGPPRIASLASIPERRELLEDCVLSLLAQCDRVRVFLNGYGEVPDFLLRERVEIRRSESFDDRGDAGKFAWIGDDDPAGYRIVADDDLIFPPDFAATMIAALGRYDNRAIVGLHGVLIKQPITAYYDPACRTAFHFQSALRRDRAVHVLGTNSICFHSDAVRMRWADFMWPNMADIFLARYARQVGLPMIAVARRSGWVREGKSADAIDTIYEHSSKRTGSRFDTSWIQDALIKSCAPMTILRPDAPKIAAVFVVAAATAAEEAFAAWRRAASSDVEWLIVVIDVSDAHAVADWFADAPLGFEAHLIATPGRNAIERVNDALALCDRLRADAFALIHGTVRFTGDKWIVDALSLLKRGPWLSLIARGSDARSPDDEWAESGAFLAVLARDRYRSLAPLDIAAADLAAALSDWLAALGEATGSDMPESEAAWRAVCGAFVVGDGAGAKDAASAEITLATAPGAAPEAPAFVPRPALTINDFFEQVLVINLERRRDRRRSVSRRLARAGILARRVEAIDGEDPAVRAEYERYCLEPRIEAPEARPISSSFQFFCDYDSQAARAAYQEAQFNGKAIRSAGAWAYLQTWRGILERALRERTSSLLVFDDDVVFHRDAPALFAAAAGATPGDWMLVQLGSLQHHWEAPWMKWRSRVLYSTAGVAIGSHAVGLSLEVVPYLLDQVSRMQLPFDIGALAAASCAFSDRCFVVAPNIAIQSLADSDIATSRFQRGRDAGALAKTYRWRLEDYDFDAPPRAARVKR